MNIVFWCKRVDPSYLPSTCLSVHISVCASLGIAQMKRLVAQLCWFWWFTFFLTGQNWCSRQGWTELQVCFTWRSASRISKCDAKSSIHSRQSQGNQHFCICFLIISVTQQQGLRQPLNKMLILCYMQCYVTLPIERLTAGSKT